jgi:uncharacterized protein
LNQTNTTDHGAGEPPPQGERVADKSGAARPPLWRRVRGLSSFLLISLALHIPLFVYPVLRLCDWFDLGWLLTPVISVPLIFSQVFSRMYLRANKGPWTRPVRQLADLFLGVSPILLFTVLALEIPVALDVLLPQSAASLTLGVALLGCMIGMYSAMIPRVEKVRFSSTKLTRPIRFVQITDVHIGSRNVAFLERIMVQINRLQPDFLCITGDFIDGRGIPESDLRSLKSVLGPIYFCIGNHEKYEDFDDIMLRLDNLGVNVLRNTDTRFSDEVQVIGVDDMDDAAQVGRQLNQLEVDRDAFVLLLYHRPRGLIAAAKAGVDLMLSGHTHNGQIVPFNLVVGRVFDKMKGMYHHDQTRLYVSQGTGTWGPVMRVGTRSEITLFEVSPAEAGNLQQAS